MKPMVDQAFWSDPDIEGSKAGVKLTALWLITNSQTNLLGICGASEGRYVFETGLDSKALASTLEALPRAFVRVGSVIFVRNYVRHQFGSGEKLKRNNFFVALKSLFLNIKDENLKSLVLQEYPEFQEALQRACDGLSKPKDVKVSKGNKEEVQEEDDHFPSFWETYPKKVGRPDAVKAWNKLKCNSKPTVVLNGLCRCVASEEWHKENGKFIPHPATWLNREGWNDQLTPHKNGSSPIASISDYES